MMDLVSVPDTGVWLREAALRLFDAWTRGGAGSALHPTPNTLHPTPYTLHPEILNPEP